MIVREAAAADYVVMCALIRELAQTLGESSPVTEATCLIEELVVSGSARDRGAGSRLVEALLGAMKTRGCAEVSVTVMSENEAALRFYRSHGLVDEAVLLERHFDA